MQVFAKAITIPRIVCNKYDKYDLNNSTMRCISYKITYGNTAKNLGMQRDFEIKFRSTQISIFFIIWHSNPVQKHAQLSPINAGFELRWIQA